MLESCFGCNTAILYLTPPDGRCFITQTVMSQTHAMLWLMVYYLSTWGHVATVRNYNQCVLYVYTYLPNIRFLYVLRRDKFLHLQRFLTNEFPVYTWLIKMIIMSSLIIFVRGEHTCWLNRSFYLRPIWYKIQMLQTAHKICSYCFVTYCL